MSKVRVYDALNHRHVEVDRVDLPSVGIERTDAGDQLVADTVERELPGFWAFLKARHPKFAGYGEPSGPPLGYIQAFEVHEAMAETIPAYVAHLRERP